MFDTLEPRQLFAAAGASDVPTVPQPAPNVDTIPTLVIDGTDGPDDISFRQSGNTLVVVKNRVTTTHNVSGVVRIRVRGLGGDDRLAADPSVTKPVEMLGGAGDDELRGGSGHDRLFGGGAGTADPTVVTEYGEDTIHGGGGNDTIVASRFGAATVHAGPGNDSVYGSDRVDLLNGEAGNDIVWGREAGDVIDGGAGNDDLHGEADADHVYGRAGDDALHGDDGDDHLHGNENNDAFFPGAGANHCYGDAGDDTFHSGIGADDLRGGTGFDTASYRHRVNAVTVTLDDLANDGVGGEGDDVRNDVESVVGTAGDDRLTGNAYANKLFGEGGADRIWGGSGDDDLFGGPGNDQLFGDGGADRLFGENGDDVLVAIGGGAADRSYGGANLDNFWLDDAATETHDASGTEIAKGNDHRVASFHNGASKELLGQDLADPNPQDLDKYLKTFDPANVVTPAYASFDGLQLFSPGGPKLDHVNQGSVGDCAFMSAVGAVVKASPDRIRSSIVDLGDGTYAARFYDWGGQAQYVRIDNDLPKALDAGPAETKPYYAGLGTDGSLWVALYEKAFAAYKGGSYQAINGMTIAEPFRRMGLDSTGVTVPMNGVASLKNIRAALDAGKAVTVGSTGAVDGSQFVGGHGYTVVSVTPDFSAITVRNPWGRDGGAARANDADPNDGYVTYTAFEFQWIFTQSRAATVP